MENKLTQGRISTRKITVIGLLSAITITMGMLNIGFIRLPMTDATIMHLPVIIGAIIEGPIVGGVLGLIFGLFSMYRAFTAPTPVSFVFLDPIVAVLPRILIGLVAYYSYAGFNSLLNKVKGGHPIAIGIAAGLGTLTNTLLVLSLIYIRYGVQFVEAIGADPATAGKVILSIGLLNGIPEVIVAIVLTTVVVKALKLSKK